jgi:hypothetical protein
MKRLSQVLTGILVFATGSLADAPAVNSTSGLIIGHKAENTNSYEFLGIKYGQAPTGELRFASPKRYLAPDGTVFEASNWVNPSSLSNKTVGLTQRIECRLPSRYTACDDFPQFHWNRFRNLQPVHGASWEPAGRGLPRSEHLDEVAIKATVERDRQTCVCVFPWRAVHYSWVNMAAIDA